MKELDELPLFTALKLYRQKRSAEKIDDQSMLVQLEKQYPVLFTMEFRDFIFDVRMTIEYFREKGMDFSELLESRESLLH